MNDSSPNSSLPNSSQDHSTDYQETMDVLKVHSAIMREKDEPRDGNEPMPLWLIICLIIVAFWGGAYLLLYSGGWRSDVYNERQDSWVPVADGGGKKGVDPIAKGKQLFTANCAACHQASGQGVAGQFPPLAGAEIVLDQDGFGPNHLVKIMLNGLSGPVTVKGQTYNNVMPAWKDQLKDDQIAYILTYIRQEWGNQASPITPEGVAAIRTKVGNRPQAWTITELKSVPAQDLPTGKATSGGSPQ